MVFCVVGLFPLFFLQARSDSASINPMRAAKCEVSEEIEHLTRTALLEECLSKNYGTDQSNTTMCYGVLGCFPMDAPWTSLLRPFPPPMPPPEVDTKVNFYSRDSPDEYEVQLWPTISLNGAPFSVNRRSVFIIHGFASTGKFEWLIKMKDSYLKAADVNVFIVDWGKGARRLNYLQVASNTRIVGAEIGRFGIHLIDAYGISPQQIHLIGHSLGAQISSYVAKTIKETRGLVDRITGLDPAQPGFEGTDPMVKLNRNDASFIDVIHTNGAPFIPTLGFGLMTSAGHLDFYMNGGVMQPGCQIPNDIPKIKSILDLAKFPVELLAKWVCCSHCRAYDYFTQALDENCKIWGRKASPSRHVIGAGTLGFSEALISKITKCEVETCVPLGLDTPFYKGRGNFIATTKIFSPYCDSPKTAKKIEEEIRQSALSPSSPGIGGLLNNATSLLPSKLPFSDEEGVLEQ